MFRAIKYELNPTSTQKEQIKKTCGCCRLVYNIMLDRKIKAYKEQGLSISAYELMAQLPALKDEKSFLKEVSAKALQQSIKHLDCAYRNFFTRGGKGFPRFKKKGRKEDRYKIAEPCIVDYEHWAVRISKFGFIRLYRGNNKQIDGKIKSYTICHTNTDRYFISILYETNDKTKLDNGKSVGIDLGVKSLAVLSDGRVFENQKYLESNLARLKAIQREASRRYQRGKSKEDQSNNWKKSVKRLGRLQEHIAFQRDDYLHKVSTWIARNYSTVCVESLDIKKILKAHNLARLVSDCGWRKFLSMLEYKCDNLVKIDKWFASSQTCSVCGFKNEGVKNLAVRDWICPNCGAHHNRDLNAAINIEREGLSLCGHKAGDHSMPVPRVYGTQ